MEMVRKVSSTTGCFQRKLAIDFLASIAWSHRQHLSEKVLSLAGSSVVAHKMPCGQEAEGLCCSSQNSGGQVCSANCLWILLSFGSRLSALTAP
jgi:hypothetical protein